MTLNSVPLLEIEELSVDYISRGRLLRSGRRVRVLDSLSLTVPANQTLGLVGESGSGKTTLLLAILRLVAPAEGDIRLNGDSLFKAHGARLRLLQREIQVVFQNPFSSLDPRMTVFDLVSEPLQIHAMGTASDRRERVRRLLDSVGLPTALSRAYAPQLSGGQAQRVALARALALRPKLILLDEPTSALDVSVQAQVLNLLVDLQAEFRLTYLFVSHDLAVVRHLSDQIAVMYLGEIVELGDTAGLFSNPQHPYTQALLSADRLSSSDRQRRIVLAGAVPSFSDPPSGCRFHTRCPYVMDVCLSISPRAHRANESHWARCHLLGDASATAIGSSLEGETENASRIRPA